jgi:hypothetical protein
MGWKLFRVMRHTTYASLPLLPAGALAFPMDKKRLYISDGARWVDTSEPPIGSPYLRAPGDPLPSSLWPGTTWSKVSGGSGSGALQGTTLRFEGAYTGHDTVTYNAVLTSQNKTHNHGGATGGMSGNNPHAHGFQRWDRNGGGNDTTWPSVGSVSRFNDGTVYSTDISHTHSISSDGGNEARPVCVGVEYYRRTA